LYPVNTHEVVDYLTVVKTPMDFTTMKNKKYSTLKEFKEDFILVCENAKAYNEPFTIYHKEAERIQEIGLEMINESKKVEILPEPEEDEESQNEFEDEDEFGDERDGTSEKRGGGANRRGDKSKSKKEIGQRLSFGISTQKKIPNYTRFEISKIPSIVKKFSESIQELSENEFLNMQNCTIDELYLQLNDQQKTSIDTTSEEKYVSSLSNFVESITNQSKNLSNVLQKYGLTNGKEINLDVSKFLSLEIKNSEIIKDIENVEGDFDLTLEVKKYLE
jgi:bromodomain-containing protein 9